MGDPAEAGTRGTRHLSSVEAARKLYHDFARGDVEAVLGSLHDDIEWYEAEGNPYQPDGTPFRGAQEIVEKLFARLAQEWESFSVAPRSFHECRNGIVVVEGRYGGTFRETGRTLDCQVCHVLCYQDGKLRRFQQYVDTAQLRSVMGA
ncbi:MAG: nuclear transport factor 2 family protein [Pseudomonadota bacterium]|nr:nuclear transport factor 2 family protein [Pseudomonadota bacterium]